MRPGISLLVAAISLTAKYPAAPHTTPVFTRVHTVSIHVKDLAVHEAVYRFLREELQLPLVYDPVTVAQRRYVGLWAGNLVLEPCGPFTNIAYGTPDFKAIFCGLTFEAYRSAQQSRLQLELRHIKHRPLGSAFVIISDPNLVQGNLVASIMDNPSRVEEAQKHAKLTAQLKEGQGGPLGLEYVSEIQVGYTNLQEVEAWAALLAPTERIKPGLWQFSNGPSLRLVKSQHKEIIAVVLKVKSLEAATRYLRMNDLLGHVSGNRVQVKAPGGWEFDIVLEE